MGRGRRSGGGGGGGSMFGSRSRKPASSVPARRAPAAPPATQKSSGGGMLSGIGSTIAQGMAFGTGSAIAHRAVGAVAGSMSGGSDEQPMESGAPMMEQQQGQSSLAGQACGQDKQMFFECLQVNKGDQQSCSFLYETLQQCQLRGNDNQLSFQ
mmetsp:Transcript_4042/g.3810  ORF Transcript_4042/g.3810 Transcript_4042/m.3810 type:complete len:154 (-) Transcript_4042:382-843(-)|eukprot:CAMPEP_0197824822 /NCGR_PEP_ID=MMETSP1437-20131217/2032_1 /TAXON_ID=49252 ORGANISM="Eucampia antarctica, Strain CCMP1452" /NCGR_SAMPLE_ID=MMETSP1437 /ASSEMBLY_ACC=CAM_ASM_001096 /LENGTH=153 /DNA_ID=CAMNT_0043424603 /DNA_START=108 /DNA_END=569 /DNA_ORIENTATION=-